MTTNIKYCHEHLQWQPTLRNEQVMNTIPLLRWQTALTYVCHIANTLLIWTILNRLSFWLKLYLIRNNTFMCCTMSSSFHSSIQVVRSYIYQRSNLENISKVSNSQCYQGIKDNVRLWISPYFKMWKCFNTSA